MTTPSKPVRVRYAPSPTGDFHVGGARTALFNYLFARHHGGQFILRIEDTDQKRYNPQALTWLLDGLRYLELEWDEGPDIGGDFGPYTQTERLELYQKYCHQLIDEGHAYRCFCTPERLAQVRQERQKQGLSGYDRHCRNLSAQESAARADAGESFTVRLKMPLEGDITVTDAIRGDITFQFANLQDAVIMKSDGIPTYHLAVVVDDHHMQISHVIRGDEWVNSLPLHVYLYRALGWEPPVFAHMSLILNPTGKGKMSKREGRAPDGRVLPVFVRTFQELGYLPDALVNYMATVGWSFDDKTEIMTRRELIERFSLERVNTSPSTWNYDKLNHFNGLYIRNLAPDELADRLLPYLHAAGINADRDTIRRIAPAIQERLTVLTDAAEWVDFFFVDELPEFDLNLLVPKKMALADVPPILRAARNILAQAEFTHDALDAALRQGAKAAGLKPGQMFQPIRIAVCGKKVAPPLFNTLEVLGRQTTLKRLDSALARLEK
ncbi:MAG: glutamate--tRNA ligase [Chloroflexi bacterium]|nr:MAG: glutamate--tRNA ligase [Chloroflexota bacterium]